MSQKYSLPCQCGGMVAVETRQAGESVVCDACGKPLDVPKLRELRQLDVLDEVPSGKTKRKWSELEGALFVMGTLALLIAAASAGYTYLLRSQLDVRKPDPADIQFSRDMDEIPLDQSWELWKQYKEKTIQARDTPYHVRAQEMVDRLNRWLIAFAGIAAVGSVSIIFAMLRITFLR